MVTTFVRLPALPACTQATGGFGVQKKSECESNREHSHLFFLRHKSESKDQIIR